MDKITLEEPQVGMPCLSCDALRLDEIGRACAWKFSLAQAQQLEMLLHLVSIQSNSSGIDLFGRFCHAGCHSRGVPARRAHHLLEACWGTGKPFKRQDATLCMSRLRLLTCDLTAGDYICEQASCVQAAQSHQVCSADLLAKQA